MQLLRLTLCLAIASYGWTASRPDWKDLRVQVKKTLHVPEDLPHLDDKYYGQSSPAPGIAADRVSYRTEYGLRVPAIVYHPAGPSITKRPALLIVNGHGGDKSSWYAYYAGILYARAGAVVLTYDPIGEFERNRERASNTSQHDQLVDPEDMGRRMGGLMIADVMQAAAYLATRKDVDDKRIAVLGYSMGSFISSLACAVDTDVHACVLVGGGDLDGPGGYWDSSGKKMCQAIPYQSLRFLGDRGAVLYALHAKRGPTLVWNGTVDRVVDIPGHPEVFFADLKKRTVAELGTSKDVFDFGFTPEGGHRPYFVTKPVALWLQKQLKFPAWTTKIIEAMPEIRISEWAAKNKVEARNLTNATGEGGTMALAADVPAVSRESLHAIPDAVWQSDMDRYIYETWLERAEAAVRAGAPQ